MSGLHCCTGFSLVVESWGYSSFGAWARLSSCGTWALLLHGMWNLWGPGIEPTSPALAGTFFTTKPPGEAVIKLLNLGAESAFAGSPQMKVLWVNHCLSKWQDLTVTHQLCFFFGSAHFGGLFWVGRRLSMSMRKASHKEGWGLRERRSRSLPVLIAPCPTAWSKRLKK